MHTCRSVNAEVILIHESNSKNNLKHVVDMAGSLLDWSAEWEVAKTLRQGQKKLQKNVVYDSTARNLIGRNENIWDGSWVLKHMRWTKRQGWLSYKSQSTSPPVLVMNKEKQGWLSYVKINKSRLQNSSRETTESTAWHLFASKNEINWHCNLSNSFCSIWPELLLAV